MPYSGRTEEGYKTHNEREKQRYREIQADPVRKARWDAHQKATRERNAHKEQARGKLRAAGRSGRVIKPKVCEDCYEEKPLQGAHHDYDKPYDVLWLCSACHGRYDRGNRPTYRSVEERRSR